MRIKTRKLIGNFLKDLGIIKVHKYETLQTDKKGGDGMMFGSELMIGSIRAQANRLKFILGQIEMDEHWKNKSSYYASEIQDIEKALRIIRKMDLAQINQGNANCYINKKVNN